MARLAAGDKERSVYAVLVPEALPWTTAVQSPSAIDLTSLSPNFRALTRLAIVISNPISSL